MHRGAFFSVIIGWYNKMLASVVREVKGHGSQMSDDLGEIYKVIAWRDYVVSLALDNYIKIWDGDLKLVSSHYMTGYNLISLACDHDHLYLGDGDGNIRILDEQLKVMKWLKICEDNISDIKIYGERLVATAYDGTIATVDLKTYEMNTVNVEGQLFEVAFLKGKYFVSGTRSYQLDVDLSNAVEIEKVNHFLQVQGNVYGVSDRLGVFNSTKKISTFEPCDIIAVAGSRIIGASDSGITIYTPSEQGLSWKSEAIPFKNGYPKRGLVILGEKQVVIGGDDGRLYKLQLHD